jgi:RNA polymerase sporulation-specific sigma factor
MDENFIAQYSNLIYSLTHYFEFYNCKEDLYQAGCVGLIQAYQNYDESFGTKFSTYAYSYILGEMKKLVRMDKGVKVSKSLSQLNFKIEQGKAILSQKLMREPSLLEISEYLDIPVSLLEESLLAIQSLIYLDKPVSMDDGEVTLSDIVPSKEMDLTTYIAFKEELSNLSYLEKRLVIERYLQDKTQSEVAKMFGMNQVQVSRFESKVKQKIKQNMA